jgi:very-short-patch-repair endonuclease
LREKVAAKRPDEGDWRDAWLSEEGFRVLRLPNDLVIAATEIAIGRIRAALSR